MCLAQLLAKPMLFETWSGNDRAMKNNEDTKWFLDHFKYSMWQYPVSQTDKTPFNTPGILKQSRPV